MGIMCVNPKIPAYKDESVPRKGLNYAFELNLTVGKLIVLWLLL